MSVIVDAGSMAHLANQLSSEIDPAGCGFWFGVSVVLTREVFYETGWRGAWPARRELYGKLSGPNATKVQVFQILQILLFFMFGT